MYDDEVGTCEWQCLWLVPSFYFEALSEIVRQNLPHNCNLSWPGCQSGRPAVQEKRQPQKSELIKDICLQKIKAKFWGENLLSVHILGSFFFFLSFFFEKRAWLRKTNEKSISEECAEGGAQDCTMMLWSGSKSDQSNVLQQKKTITDTGIGRPWP